MYISIEKTACVPYEEWFLQKNNRQIETGY